MLTKLCLSVFLLSLAVFGVRVEDNEFGGSGIDYPRNSPRFAMDMDINEKDRIFGGQEAAVGQFPHQVSLSKTFFSHYCGGSILNERFILTAAHCVHGSEPNKFGVIVGAHGIDQKGISHKVQRLIVHEGYVAGIMGRNDVALVQTITPIQFNDLVRPILLNPDFIEIAKGTTSGWGKTNDGIQNLKFVNMVTVTNDECRRALDERFPDEAPAPVHDYDTICAASGLEGHGGCYGDSGSPFAVDNQLVGVVSWGYDCGSGLPEGYTRVSTFIDWINLNMEKFQGIQIE